MTDYFGTALNELLSGGDGYDDTYTQGAATLPVDSGITQNILA